MKPVLIPVLLLAAGCCLLSCHQQQRENDKEKAIKEIGAAEKDFEKRVAQKGLSEAFAFYAAENAVMKRAEDSLITGKENIRQFYAGDFFTTATVSWSAGFIDVSNSGDLGYTYGMYTWQKKDSMGTVHESKGYFHTVWKKQGDGSWKFVWD